jgi:hypothetical protein
MTLARASAGGGRFHLPNPWWFPRLCGVYLSLKRAWLVEWPGETTSKNNPPPNHIQLGEIILWYPPSCSPWCSHTTPSAGTAPDSDPPTI